MLNIFAAAMSKFGWILERSQWHRGSGGSVIFRHVRSTAFLFFWASFFLAATASSNSTNTTTVKQPVLNCDPCIDRPTYTIKVIAHGTKGDPFWQRLRTASVQSALDMRVALEFELYGKSSRSAIGKNSFCFRQSLNSAFICSTIIFKPKILSILNKWPKTF